MKKAQDFRHLESQNNEENGEEVRSQKIRGTLQLDVFGDRAREVRMRWVGHVWRRLELPDWWSRVDQRSDKEEAAEAGVSFEAAVRKMQPWPGEAQWHNRTSTLGLPNGQHLSRSVSLLCGCYETLPADPRTTCGPLLSAKEGFYLGLTQSNIIIGYWADNSKKYKNLT